jgi:hypothetical protein
MWRPLSDFSGPAESFYYTARLAGRGAKWGGTEVCSLDGVRGEKSSAASAPMPNPIKRKVIAVGGSYRSGRNGINVSHLQGGRRAEDPVATPARLLRRELTAGKMLAIGGRQRRSTQRCNRLAKEQASDAQTASPSNAERSRVLYRRSHCVSQDNPVGSNLGDAEIFGRVVGQNLQRKSESYELGARRCEQF